MPRGGHLLHSLAEQSSCGVTCPAMQLAVQRLQPQLPAWQRQLHTHWRVNRTGAEGVCRKGWSARECSGWSIVARPLQLLFFVFGLVLGALPAHVHAISLHPHTLRRWATLFWLACQA